MVLIKVITLSLFIVTINGAPPKDSKGNDGKTDEDYDDGNDDDYEHQPRYVYNYGVNDPTTGDFKQLSESRHGDIVQGQYSLVEADGTIRLVEYVADNVNGFKATVTRVAPRDTIPTARPSAPRPGGRPPTGPAQGGGGRPNMKFQFDPVTGEDLSVYTLRTLAGYGNGYAILRVPHPGLQSAVVPNNGYFNNGQKPRFLLANIPVQTIIHPRQTPQQQFLTNTGSSSTNNYLEPNYNTNNDNEYLTPVSHYYNVRK